MSRVRVRGTFVRWDLKNEVNNERLYEVDLIPPTADEIAKLKEEDEVLIRLSMEEWSSLCGEEDGSREAQEKIVAILDPAHDKEQSLREEKTCKNCGNRAMCINELVAGGAKYCNAWVPEVRPSPENMCKCTHSRLAQNNQCSICGKPLPRPAEKNEERNCETCLDYIYCKFKPNCNETCWQPKPPTEVKRDDKDCGNCGKELCGVFNPAIKSCERWIPKKPPQSVRELEVNNLIPLLDDDLRCARIPVGTYNVLVKIIDYLIKEKERD